MCGFDTTNVLFLFLWSAQPLRGRGIEPSHKFLEGYLCCMASFCNLHFDFTQKINGPIDVTFLTTQAFDQEPYLHGESSPLKCPTALRTRNLWGNKYARIWWYMIIPGYVKLTELQWALNAHLVHEVCGPHVVTRLNRLVPWFERYSASLVKNFGNQKDIKCCDVMIFIELSFNLMAFFCQELSWSRPMIFHWVQA